MSDTAYNPGYLSTASTGRHSFDSGKLRGTEMTRLADKIIEYKGDKEGLAKLRAKFKNDYENSPKNVARKGKNWWKDKADDHYIYDKLPPVITHDERMYLIFSQAMCGYSPSALCRKYHTTLGQFKTLVKTGKVISYTELDSGKTITAKTYAELAKKAKKKGLDAPRTAGYMAGVVYRNGGSFVREKARNNKGAKLGLIGTVETRFYMQEVVYEEANDEQGE